MITYKRIICFFSLIAISILLVGIVLLIKQLTMKIRRILFCMAIVAISQISMAQKVQTAAQVPALDVDKQLQYCHKQVKRALAELQQIGRAHV